MVKIASTAPAAPRQWPVAPFVDETGVLYAFSSPSASLSTLVSAVSPTGVGVGHVRRIRRQTVAAELRVDVRPARSSVFELLEDHDGPCLAHDEAVTLGVEGAR